MITEAQIQAAAQKLAEVYQPEAIYLFGSYAWGEPTEDSDLDLMIVMPDNVLTKHHLRVAMSKTLWEANLYNFPIDILLSNKTKFAKFSEDVSSLSYLIAHEGKKVYGTLQKMAA